MPLFQITHRFTGSVLFELECGSLMLAVEAAVKSAGRTQADVLALIDECKADIA